MTYMNLEKIKQITTTTISVIALCSVVFTGAAFLASPWTKPYLDIPQKIESLENSIYIQSNPQLINFNGRGIVVGVEPFKAGERINFIYSLKRVASCETLVELRLFDVGNGTYISMGTINSTKAPITTNFINFKIPLTLPKNLPDGEYTYHPVIKPVNCGIYKEFTPPHTDSFFVRSSDG